MGPWGAWGRKFWIGPWGGTAVVRATARARGIVGASGGPSIIAISSSTPATTLSTMTSAPSLQLFRHRHRPQLPILTPTHVSSFPPSLSSFGTSTFRHPVFSLHYPLEAKNAEMPAPS